VAQHFAISEAITSTACQGCLVMEFSGRFREFCGAPACMTMAEASALAAVSRSLKREFLGCLRKRHSDAPFSAQAACGYRNDWPERSLTECSSRRTASDGLGKITVRCATCASLLMLSAVRAGTRTAT
jgi:hypothetical protein